ncbi:hypothetical protein GCM10008927_15020 [Amylibacter ulvae]|uniref:Pilus assembly protein n=1 Tax=Paramylibacter ulvae TaxID=1651968 RepID=A0ABQ3D104_9RHOB|nr:hypothetical protein [Amylibacter ulvae]GHA50779.1 hypothetical protein GCM10008927_15020 [Amylibacter ulvae]
MKLFTMFKKDESGAVTVDWVVLAAALVILALGIGNVLRGPIEETVGKIGAQVTASGVAMEEAAADATGS